MHVRTIREIISGRPPLTAPASTSVVDAARLMRERRVGAIVVLDGSHLAGIFTERDALFRVLAEGRDPNRTTLADAMTRHVKTISPDKPFMTALAMMHEGKFRHLPVVEGGGHPIGMISARDAMGPELEQFMYSLIVDEQARDVLA
jgi:CBS domain-containing protein